MRYSYFAALSAILFAHSSFATDQLDSNAFKPVLELAMKKDYQAQRNVAYGYASFPYKGQEKNPILGCAWYQVVLNSGSPKINSGDRGNVTVYCEKLDEKSQQAALGQARVLYKTIYKSTPKF